ncbi:type II secretion system secretin GspD [Piscinibacter sp.]|uniref:type II secretion system secretin GspD n=1 Tax=Piscinibacter sp. TaxID=1903157 RepID=UPI002B58A465|nr:type II secretion system secretin GspD [Albitalea sp.]HUG24860.1 type II secretion system secretin GspD [Albitalea sp.]
MKQGSPSTSWTKLPRRLAAHGLAGLLSVAMIAAPVSHAQSPGARFKGEPVTLNFVNADIEGVTRAMAAILKQQFVVDPRVKGTITLYSEEPLTPREAYLNFLAALRGLGFTVVESGGLYKVVPEADAKLQTGTVSVGGVDRRGDQVITQIFRLSHESANNMVPVLRPLISPNNTINANPGTNSLIITDYADNLQRIGKIISALDTPASGDVEVIPLQYAIASDIAALVQRLTDPSPGGPQVPGMSQIGAASIFVEPRSNALLVRAPNPARMASIRALVAKLDQPTAGPNALGNMWVVYLKNADAVKLAEVLRAAFSASGGGATTSTGTSAAPAPAPTQAAGVGGAGASPQATAPVAASPSPSTGGFVQADPATNSLIITGPEPMYRQVRAMIDQLDSRRAQVYIESLIVEVGGDDLAEFGFQWQGISGKKGDSNIVAGGTNFGDGSSNIIDLSVAAAGGRATAGTALQALPNGFNIGVLKNLGDGLYGLSAIARLLQSQSNANIMSTPNLVTLDNEEAKIVVGRNVPFVTGQFTSTGTGTTNPFQTIERKDVGITLRIKPQVGENGTVRMTIFQESSDVIAQATGTGSAGPTTSKRSIESTVVVDDGQIIALGGLIEDRFEHSNSKVPLLGDLPLVGALFRAEHRERRRTNLMVFLRPVVLRDADSSNRLSIDRYDYMRGMQQDAQPAPSVLMPINEAPLMPPAQAPAETVPLAPPPTPLSPRPAASEPAN